MKKNHPWYSANVSSSRLMPQVFCCLSLFIIVIMVFVLWLNQVQWGFILWNSGLVISVLAYMFLRHLPIVTINKISFEESGSIIIGYGEQFHKGTINQTSLVCDWWCWLEVTVYGASQPINQLVWRDMIDQRSYRRLARIVRIRRRLI
ncbi:MAG: hypothetical protein HRU24_01090 [Gammaproteobacteria bacterium]|nr:hypothetical protein [Gammaproteobacteria bacterium]